MGRESQCDSRIMFTAFLHARSRWYPDLPRFRSRLGTTWLMESFVLSLGGMIPEPQAPLTLRISRVLFKQGVRRRCIVRDQGAQGGVETSAKVKKQTLQPIERAQ